MTEDHHLDDDQLSAALDGEGEGEASAHVRACATCAGRLDALRRAVALVGEPVAPPDPEVVDAAVAAAVRANETPRPSELTRSRRRRRYLAPSAPWVAAAAAAIALLVGLSALVQTTGGGDEAASDIASEESAGRRLSSAADDQAGSGAAAFDAADAEAGGDAAYSSGTAGSAAGPALEDLGAYEDPAALAAAVRSRVEAIPRPQRAQEAEEGGEDVPCQPAAESVGADRLAGLAHAATAQWKGEPAFVLTFELADHGDDDAEHQVYVMSSSACVLLAEARF